MTVSEKHLLILAYITTGQLDFTLEQERNTGDGKFYTDYLRDEFYKQSNDGQQYKKLQIPLRKRGKNYELENLNVQQQAVVICALDAVIKFFNNNIDYKPFRATVVGCGGTGKCFIINTIIVLIRKYTNRNDTVKVAAPYGRTSYNVQGCTLHRCLSLLVNVATLCQPLSDDK